MTVFNFCVILSKKIIIKQKTLHKLYGATHNLSQTLTTLCLQSNSGPYFHSCIPPLLPLNRTAQLCACQIESPPQRLLHLLCPCIIRHTHRECAMTDYWIRRIMTPDTSVTAPWAATASAAAPVNKDQRWGNTERDEQGGGAAGRWMERANGGA